MIKRILLFLIAISSPNLFSQNIFDAVLLSGENTNGTARFESMGGAFGALGGDLSSININPAGSSVYNDNEYALTLGIDNKSNKSSFFNTTKESNNTKFSINQGGVVWLWKNSGDGDINKISFGINAQTEKSFRNALDINGLNPSNSIDKYFLNNSNGFSASELSVGNNETVSSVYKYLGETFGYSAQQAFLAYQAYLTEYDSNNNTFSSFADSSGGVNQKHLYETKGVNTKYNINFAVQFRENYFFGLNINTHEVFFEKYLLHKENNFISSSNIKEIIYENNLVTQGEGFSIQIGAIAKFNSLRFGLSYQSPTWYRLFDETYQSLETRAVDLNGVNYRDVVNPGVISTYPAYKLSTPSKLTTSAAIIFGKSGLISIDVISKDYSKIKLKPKRDFLNTNKTILSSLTNTIDFRLGGEYRINQLSLRSGYEKFSSPYKNSFYIKDANSVSFGLGYDFGSTLVNFSYKMMDRESNHQLFDTGLEDTARITTDNILSTISVIFKF